MSPFFDNVTASTTPSIFIVCPAVPESTFHSFRVSSRLPLAAILPSGESATDSTVSSWPDSVFFNAPVLVSHTLIDLSKLPVQIELPSPAKESDVISPVWPFSVCFTSPVWMSINLMALLLESAAARVFPSGETARGGLASFIVSFSAPVSASHSLMTNPRLPLTSVLLSGENATALTFSISPDMVFLIAPFSTTGAASLSPAPAEQLEKSKERVSAPTAAADRQRFLVIGISSFGVLSTPIYDDKNRRILLPPD